MQTSGGQSDRRRRFDRLVSTWHQDMYRYAVWLCRDPAVAEDIVQEALLRAWKSLDGLREEQAAKQWVLAIVRRENARYFGRKRPDTVDIHNLSAAHAAMLAETADPQVDELREAIFKLEDDYREPLVLQVLLGHSTQEIADLMGIKQGAVLTRLHRARIKLRQAIGDETAA